MPLLWRSSRESRSERCKRAFLLAPICKVLLAPTLVSDRATTCHETGDARWQKRAFTGFFFICWELARSAPTGPKHLS